ncbi:radical SAM protein [Candidatus Eisenbacteria bacterium]|uniref:Radical SAM protein n=1 Tax=Eiseniibacteriota bacterium TaxID=2212470 RepID=A0ABV6YIM1_UNCEI
MTHPRNFRILHLFLTSGCNLGCSYCFQYHQRPVSMDWATLRAAIDLSFTTDHPTIELAFTGGEPLLEFDLLCRGVRYATEKVPAEKELKLTLMTNGLLLREDVVAFCERHGIDTRLSFDGLPPAQETRAAGTFRRLDRFLGGLRRVHPIFFRDRLRVSITLPPAGVPVLADSVAYFLGHEVAEIAIAPTLDAPGGWSCDRVPVLEEAFNRIFALSLSHLREKCSVPVLFLRKPEWSRLQTTPPVVGGRKAGAAGSSEEPRHDRGSHAPRPMCGVLSGESLTVDTDGQVHACLLFARANRQAQAPFLQDEIAGLGIASVSDPDFQRRYHEFIEAHLEPPTFSGKQNKYSSLGRCRECRFYNSCVLCPVSIGLIPENRDPNRVPDFYCAFNMISLRYRELFPPQPRRVALAGRPVRQSTA